MAASDRLLRRSLQALWGDEGTADLVVAAAGGLLLPLHSRIVAGRCASLGGLARLAAAAASSPRPASALAFLCAIEAAACRFRLPASGGEVSGGDNDEDDEEKEAAAELAIDPYAPWVPEPHRLPAGAARYLVPPPHPGLLTLESWRVPEPVFRRRVWACLADLLPEDPARRHWPLFLGEDMRIAGGDWMHACLMSVRPRALGCKSFQHFVKRYYGSCRGHELRVYFFGAHSGFPMMKVAMLNTTSSTQTTIRSRARQHAHWLRISFCLWRNRTWSDM
eukprot:tig00000492_g1402.t1